VCSHGHNLVHDTQIVLEVVFLLGVEH
jgi:hypothetical protein